MKKWFLSDGAPRMWLCVLQTEVVLSAKQLRHIGHVLQASEVESLPKGSRWIGPRAGMTSPWSTHVREILSSNLSVGGILYVERFVLQTKGMSPDPLLEACYTHAQLSDLGMRDPDPEPLREIEDIADYVQREGLDLSAAEIQYLCGLARAEKRCLTDAEIFGFAQVNSEHCRHHTFRARFVCGGKTLSSPFALIKRTTETHPNEVLSAYTDNVALLRGRKENHFGVGEERGSVRSYGFSAVESVYTLKAETHNFPTTVEPFYGAGTGTGGEIRDRLAGGRGTLPLAGTAVYMTSFSRLANHPWEQRIPARAWLYQSPAELLVKASDGASDYANKFGQPLIAGSVLTLETQVGGKLYAYDKVVMLAGGVGWGRLAHHKKQPLRKGDRVLMLGGDNYRIGMGGSAVSSRSTGEQSRLVAQQAIQRANPEMQRRIHNLIRTLTGQTHNPLRSVHDHGAGGHLNCFAEMLSETGGDLWIDALPKGDLSLSDKELLLNESQERMGVVVAEEDLARVKEVAKRERVPLYVVGEVTQNKRLCFFRRNSPDRPVFSLKTEEVLSPSTDIQVSVPDMVSVQPAEVLLSDSSLHEYLEKVLALEAVACKDWLTHKVDRCVGGKVAKQPTCGPLQLPLNNVGVVATEYAPSPKGLATAIGHAPLAGCTNPAIGAQLSLYEALSNLVFAPLEDGLSTVSLSANWMWPNQSKQDLAQLHQAVQQLSACALSLGINIPTGKDSLSMVQRYPDGQAVAAPGTLVVSALGKVSDVRQVVEPVLQALPKTDLWYVPLARDWALGGSQLLLTLGKQASMPELMPPEYLARVFRCVQQLIKQGEVLAGHDVSEGGLLSCMLEMCYAQPDCVGLGVRMDELVPHASSSRNISLAGMLFSEAPALLLQVPKEAQVARRFRKEGIAAYAMATPIAEPVVAVSHRHQTHRFDVAKHRDMWMQASHRLDRRQTLPKAAKSRREHLGKQPLMPTFPSNFVGKMPLVVEKERVCAGILRDQGSNGEQEMALALHLAGFEVRDVHMTDLLTGRESLEGLRFLAFVGGFTHADALGAGRGWAVKFRYHDKARACLNQFYQRVDTMSLGVCNGCQLMMELSLLSSEEDTLPMEENESGKFECAFVDVRIPESSSLMLKPLFGTRLSVWSAHHQGRFARKTSLPMAMQYAYEHYPANPNGSDRQMAGLCSTDGRHLALMPHIERSLFPWNWAYYPKKQSYDECSPWLLAFRAAHEWLSQRT